MKDTETNKKQINKFTLFSNLLQKFQGFAVDLNAFWYKHSTIRDNDSNTKYQDLKWIPALKKNRSEGNCVTLQSQKQTEDGFYCPSALFYY